MNLRSLLLVAIVATVLFAAYHSWALKLRKEAVVVARPSIFPDDGDWELYHTLEQRADSTELLDTKEYLLIIGIATSGKAAKYRQIRDVTRRTFITWNQSDVLILFFDARLSSMPFDRAQEYVKEYQEFGDIAFVPGDDNAAEARLGSTNKQLGWWEYVYRHYFFRYAAKLDDDVYVHVPRLAAYAREHLPKSECFAGREQASRFPPLQSSFRRAGNSAQLRCGYTKAVVGQVQILSKDLVRWLGMDAAFPRWLRTPYNVVEDWALGCIMGRYKNASGEPLTVFHMSQQLLPGICAWIGGKPDGLNSVLSFHMAGNFKHQRDDTSAVYFDFFQEVFVQHEKNKRWNETLLTAFVNRPGFLSAVAGCHGKFDCGTEDCSGPREQVKRFQEQILLLNKNL